MTNAIFFSFFSGFTSRKQLLKKGKDHIVPVKTLEYTNSSLSNNSNHVRPLNFNDKVCLTQTQPLKLRELKNLKYSKVKNKVETLKYV